jgi:hypothetical protein
MPKGKKVEEKSEAAVPIKNATREVTAPFKHWLNEHRENPYPTMAEKTMLAVITRMTQASQYIDTNNHAENHGFPHNSSSSFPIHQSARKNIVPNILT